MHCRCGGDYEIHDSDRSGLQALPPAVTPYHIRYSLSQQLLERPLLLGILKHPLGNHRELTRAPIKHV